MSMRSYIEQLLSVPATDPDDARRRRLLNILLLGILVVALLGLVSIIINSISDNYTLNTDQQILLAGIVILTLGLYSFLQILLKNLLMVVPYFFSPYRLRFPALFLYHQQVFCLLESAVW